MPFFGYDSGNRVIYGTQNGKCFDTKGACEHCGSDEGEEVYICLGVGDPVTGDICSSCQEECCCLRKLAFHCDDCGKNTRL